MRTLVMLSVFTVAVAAPVGEQANIEPVQSGHAEKRSLGNAVSIVDPATVYLPPAAFYNVPSAVSHQSRKDVHTSQTVVSSIPAVAAHSVRVHPDVVPHVQAVYQAPSVYTVPADIIYSGGAAVSHQSRVDSKISSLVALEPAVIANSNALQSVSPVLDNFPSVVDARSVYVAPASAPLYQPIIYSNIW